MSAVSPNQSERTKELEDQFRRVFGESVEEVIERERRGESSEESSARRRQSRAREKLKNTISTMDCSGVGARTA